MPSDTVLIIGGGPAGLTAARAVGELGGRALVVETRERLGGMPDEANYAALTPDFRPASEAVAEMVAAVEALPGVAVRTSTRVTAREGEAGDFRLTLASGEATEVVEAGAVIIATGFQHFDPGRETQMYGYYEYEDVLTLQDLEAQLKEHRVAVPSTGKAPETLCFIQCVGSRDRRIGNTWCSKVCCGIASKEAIEVKRLVPQCKVFIFYIDMRMYGFWEDQLYWKAQEEHKVQFIRGIVTEVIRRGEKLVVKGEDTTMGRPVEAPMDMVVLSVGMEPSRGTVEMAKVLGVPLESHGFIAAPGNPLDTVTTEVPGIFVAGAAAGPKDLEDTVGMAGLAAARAVALMRQRAGTAQPVG
ncbi:MAG: CoB--CoM heterodisulfide reductase iron-sulfur subunit A family protein [Chloroflexi bacterium]|nr:MAG: CoB--CoM heterodisulfide reductase iron-sulfur subunit A family protein [Chloroflexota bacterium]